MYNYHWKMIFFSYLVFLAMDIQCTVHIHI